MIFALAAASATRSSHRSPSDRLSKYTIHWEINNNISSNEVMKCDGCSLLLYGYLRHYIINDDIINVIGDYWLDLIHLFKMGNNGEQQINYKFISDTFKIGPHLKCHLSMNSNYQLFLEIDKIYTKGGQHMSLCYNLWLNEKPNSVRSSGSGIYVPSVYDVNRQRLYGPDKIYEIIRPEKQNEREKEEGHHTPCMGLFDVFSTKNKNRKIKKRQKQIKKNDKYINEERNKYLDCNDDSIIFTIQIYPFYNLRSTILTTGDPDGTYHLMTKNIL